VSAFDVTTISDAEAAERLGYPLRSLRREIDKAGLCLRVGRRRRLTERQFVALQELLTPNAPDISWRFRPKTSKARVHLNSSARALALTASMRRTKKQRSAERSKAMTLLPGIGGSEAD